MKLRLIKIATIIACSITLVTSDLCAMKKMMEKVGLRKSETHDERLTRKMDQFEQAEQRLKSARDAAASSGGRTSSDVKRAYEDVQRTSRELRGAISSVEKRDGLKDEHVERLADFSQRLANKQTRRTEEGKREPLSYQEEQALKKINQSLEKGGTAPLNIEVKGGWKKGESIAAASAQQKSPEELEREFKLKVERANLALGKMTPEHQEEIKKLQTTPKRADQIIEEKLATPEGKAELDKLKNKMVTQVDKALEKNRDIAGKDLTVLKQEKDALQDKFLKAVNDAPNPLEKQLLTSMQIKGSKLDLLEDAIQKERNKLKSNPTDEKTQNALDRLHYEYGFVQKDQQNLTKRLKEVAGEEKAKDVTNTLESLRTKVAQAKNLESTSSSEAPKQTVREALGASEAVAEPKAKKGIRFSETNETSDTISKKEPSSAQPTKGILKKPTPVQETFEAAAAA